MIHDKLEIKADIGDALGFVDHQEAARTDERSELFYGAAG
jgi:hypothetical protein